MNCPNCDSEDCIEVEYIDMIIGPTVTAKVMMCLYCTYEWWDTTGRAWP